MADGRPPSKKIPGGGFFIFLFFIMEISSSLSHVTGMLLMFSCRKQSHIILVKLEIVNCNCRFVILLTARVLRSNDPCVTSLPSAGLTLHLTKSGSASRDGWARISTVIL